MTKFARISLIFLPLLLFAALVGDKPAMAACTKDEQGITIGILGARKDGDIYCVKKEGAIISLFRAIVQFLSIGVGLAITGGIIYGGMLYASARDNSSQVEKSKTIITNSIIGLILYILLVAISNFLIPGGLFT